jgi:hypothetical protein
MPIVTEPADYVPEHILHIDLSKICWRATGSFLGDGADNRARLTATVRIGGADHHLEAIEVAEIDSLQVGANGAEQVFEELEVFNGTDGRFETVNIEGRRYALSMTPFKE